MTTYALAGIVVAPKTGELCLVWANKPYENQEYKKVYISSLTGVDIGIGYFDKKVGGDFFRATEITGFPRTHTPDGLTEKYRKAGGYGTALYTALCLCATLDRRGVIDFKLPVKGEGCSSQTGGRSDAAEKWWTEARTEFGLVEQIVRPRQGRVRFHISDSQLPRWADGRALAQAVASSLDPADYPNARGVEIQDWRLDGSASTEYDERADAYPYIVAERKSLIAADARAPLEVPDFRLAPLSDISVDQLFAAFNEVDPDVLARANYGVLRAEGKDGEKAMMRVLGLGKRLGIANSVLERMYFRFLNGIDGAFNYRKGVDTGAEEAQERTPYEYVLGELRGDYEVEPEKESAKLSAPQSGGKASASGDEYRFVGTYQGRAPRASTVEWMKPRGELYRRVATALPDLSPFDVGHLADYAGRLQRRDMAFREAVFQDYLQEFARLNRQGRRPFENAEAAYANVSRWYTPLPESGYVGPRGATTQEIMDWVSTRNVPEDSRVIGLLEDRQVDDGVWRADVHLWLVDQWLASDPTEPEEELAYNLFERAKTQFPYFRGSPGQLRQEGFENNRRKGKRARPNGFQIVRYGGGARPNPEDPAVREEIAQLGAERAELGWDVFANES